VVATRGIVTHRKTNGFFLQTPDGEDDGDPSTSEGVFVFTGLAPPPEAQPGALVGVTGLIDEFRPGADPASPPLTELKDLEGFSPISAGNPLPRPVAIGAGDLSPWGAVDQLERFESMRVRLDALDVVGPTEGRVQAASASSISAGVFHGVLPGTPRPFREPGIEVHEPPVDACCAPYFDANPERVRVFAPSLEVAVGDRVEGVVGPLDFAERTYTVLADEGAVARSGGVGPRPAPRGQFSIGAFNLERFYNDRDDPGGDTVLAPAAYQRRLAKASLAIRGLLGMPDVLALAEVENLDTLRDLARRIDSDQAASGAPPPGYAAHLVEGNDPSLINVGYLVKPAVVVESVVQRGAADTFINPLTSAPAILFDRPPLVLRISRPFELTLIAVHLLSLLDVADPAAGPRARAKRRAQAEAVARLAQEAQSRGPVAVLGDFNAFPFNDGYVDVVGTIRGAPTPADRVALASPDLVEPDLFDAALALPPPERYSYVFRGNAQQIDHILLSADLVPRLAAFGYARVNADHPDSLRNDASRPERVSDHDAPVAVFNPR
jgi:predicted extracellular nuclease